MHSRPESPAVDHSDRSPRCAATEAGANSTPELARWAAYYAHRSSKCRAAQVNAYGDTADELLEVIVSTARIPRLEAALADRLEQDPDAEPYCSLA